MKNKLLFVFPFLFFFSCSQVYFLTPQPLKGTSIKSFMPDVQGEYSDSIIDITILKNEIIIWGERYQMTSKNPVGNEVLVKYYKDFYFASFNDSGYFSVLMGKFYENKLAVYMLNADEYSISNLKRLINVDKLNNEIGGYLIDPSKKEFDEIIDYDFFEVVNVLQKK